MSAPSPSESGVSMHESQSPAALEHPYSEFAKYWPLLIACALGVGVGLTGLPFYSFGIFMPALENEFGWSRAQIGSGMLCLAAGNIFISPILGGIVDRVGVRVISCVSLIGLACGFFALSRVSSDITVFYFSLLGLAFLGAGTTPLTWTRAISLRFNKKRGLALGLMLVGTGLASIIGPPVIQSVIEAADWRLAYLSIAGFIVCVVLPIAWFGLKGIDNISVIKPSGLHGLTRLETIQTRQFWTIAGALLLATICQAGTTVHMPALLRDHGFGATEIATSLSILGICVVVGRVTVGYLVDHVHAPYVAAVFFCLPAFTLLLLTEEPTLIRVYIAAALLGLAGGAEVDLLSYLIGRYFGLKAYGANYGLGLMFFGVGAGVGPALTGYVFDSTGSYAVALYGGMAVFLASGLLISTLGRVKYA